MLNRVLILRKIQVRRKRGFESALSCRKEGTALHDAPLLLLFLASFRVEGGRCVSLTEVLQVPPLPSGNGPRPLTWTRATPSVSCYHSIVAFALLL